jgi:Coenzyme PQQ synthesis protein D (PqqD)
MSSPRSLTPANLVVHGAQIGTADVDGEVVALHFERGFCYGLNEVGSRIWKLVETPKRIAEICATLQDEYDVPADVCESEVLALLEKLLAEGVIDVVESGTPTSNS